MSEQYLFTASLFGVVALVIWWGASLLLRDEYAKLRERLRVANLEGPAPEERGHGIWAVFQVIGRIAAGPFMPKDRDRQTALRRQLASAGIHSAAAVRLIIGCKVLFLVAGLVGGHVVGLMVGNAWLGLSFGGLIGYLLPSMWLKLEIKEHQKALQHGLPDALDLMVICVEAGLTIDAAIQRVAQELHLAHPRLARELEITHMETRVGLARAEALRNLGRRTNSPAVQGLSTMLIQAERFGTSIAAALRVHGDTLRTIRQHSAEERAAKASVKLTFPVVLFIFPAVLIVLAGPAVIGLFKSALFAE